MKMKILMYLDTRLTKKVRSSWLPLRSVSDCEILNVPRVPCDETIGLHAQIWEMTIIPIGQAIYDPS